MTSVKKGGGSLQVPLCPKLDSIKQQEGRWALFIPGHAAWL